MESKNISILAHDVCCGCRACGDVCPKSCISFHKDSYDGFMYPVVDESLCISCGLCQKVCPELTQAFNPQQTEVIAAYSKSHETVCNASSGGLFEVLAKRILRDGGVVWGASFDKALQLAHRKATNEDELKALRKSKYLQSNLSTVYKQIFSDLKDGIPTLFVGTPCQVNALRNFVSNNPNKDKLVLIDIVCHGVPSQDLFDRCMAWFQTKHQCRVVSYEFRAKGKEIVHPHSFRLTYEKNGKNHTMTGVYYKSPFYYGFQTYKTLRPSCYSCKWAKGERSSDITLADFWGINTVAPAFNPDKGVSMVMANTEKGQERIDALIAAGSVESKIFPFELAQMNNKCLAHPTKCPIAARTRLFDKMQTEPFDSVVMTELTSKHRRIFDIYYGLPVWLQQMIRRLIDKIRN